MEITNEDIGKYFKIIGNSSDHEFKKNQKVKFKGFDLSDSLMFEDDNDWWYVSPEEVERLLT